MAADSKVPNRLSKERSPYLLQHQYNPVDWYPWGDEAINKARQENKPIFLSVGYSTCHWCHVMEHTSFEVQEAADVLNKYFVSIKVDREERPDVDKVYMNYILLTTGHGGWPMSVWLEPQSLAPIFGGTYYAAHGEGRRPGFIRICESIASQWENNKEKIIASGVTIAHHLKAQNSEPLAEKDRFLQNVGEYLLAGANKRIKSFDPIHGGWGDQPKFPQPVILNALLLSHFLSNKKHSDYLYQVEMTLHRMYLGGMHDHLGGGFHRYSVTAEWSLPHFEKMLYDQAQLAISYLTAFQLTQKPIYKEAAKNIFNYVSMQLTDRATGGFYSAEDADSPLKSDPTIKREGAFYVWPYDEIKQLLSADEFKVVSLYYDLLPSGNIPSEYDPHGEMEHMNVLHIQKTDEDCATELKISVEAVRQLLDSAHKKLYEAQQQRPRPHLDDKCVVVWNAMMIQAFAKGSQILSDQRKPLLDLAQRAAQFIRANLYNPETKKLTRSYRLGPSAVEGFADDYAALIAALIDLYESCFDHTLLQWALDLQSTMDVLFWDQEHGGYFCDSGNPELHLLVRMKDDHDGAEPSYNSVAAHSLLRLYHIFQREEFKTRAENIFLAFSTHLSKIPLAMPAMTVAASLYARPPKSIVLYGPLESPTTQQLINTVRSQYDPYRIVIQASHNSEAAKFFAAQKTITLFSDADLDLSVNGQPAAYVCENFTCQLPITSPEQLQEALSWKVETAESS